MFRCIVWKTENILITRYDIGINDMVEFTISNTVEIRRYSDGCDLGIVCAKTRYGRIQWTAEMVG